MLAQYSKPIGTRTKPAPLTPEEQKERDAYQNYMYGDTYKNEPSEATKELLRNRDYDYATFYGFYTDAAKQLVRTIWVKLKTLGFSGYDETVLTGDVIACETSTDVVGPYETAFSDLSAAEQAFHNQVFLQTNYDELYKAVKGLKFNNKYVLEVWYRTQDSPSELRLALSDAFRDGESGYAYLLPFDVSQDTLIPHAQTTEWNNVFIEAFRADPFFKAYVERYEAKKREVEDVSTTLSLVGARKHKVGLNTTQLSIHNEWGKFTQTDVPVYVELTGDIHPNTEGNLAAMVMYHVNGWMVGGIYGHATPVKANSIFSSQSHELSTVLGYNMKNIFVETQIGGVWGNRMHGDVSGFRTQLRVGYDAEIISPFIELGVKEVGLAGRQEKRVGKSVCVGGEMDVMCCADTHSKISSKLIAKLTVYNSEMRVSDLYGYINWVGVYHLNDTDTVTAGLTLDHASKSKINIGFELSR
jgi:hypothetical protein